MPGSNDPKRGSKPGQPKTTAKSPSPDIWSTQGPRRHGDTDGGPGDIANPFPSLPVTFGRYRVVRLLGAGSMGAVYLARDTQLDRLVALKVPRFSSEEGTVARERFLREARAAATVQHPNICPVFDAGEHEGKHFITMAFLEGQPLTEKLAETREAIPERQVASLVRKLALALVEAHRKKVIHRDLKPANIMINERGEPVIMDFGLARRTGRGEKSIADYDMDGMTKPQLLSDANLTQAGMLLGTPAYMAPEQAEGDLSAVGPGCDVYSLGVILYELLTKRLPFEGHDVKTVIRKLLREEPKSPFAYRPSLDPHLERICMKALAKDPNERFRTMADFAAVLTSYLAATGPLSAEVKTVEPPKPKEKKKRRRRYQGDLSSEAWAGLLIAGVMGIAAIALGVFYATRPTTAEVRVEISDPAARAEVRIDGLVVPFDQDNPVLKLPVGPHVLDVTADGFLTHHEEFMLKRGDSLSIEVPLQRPVQPALIEKQPNPLRKPAALSATPKLRWSSQEDLRQGNISAPEFSPEAKLFEDKFKDDESGFEHDPKKGVGYYHEGIFNTYNLRLPNGALSLSASVPLGRGKKPVAKEAFAVDVNGRITGLGGAWGVTLGDAETPRLAVVTITTTGIVRLGGEAASGKRIDIEPTPGNHPNVKKGDKQINRLLVLVIGRYLEVYVNQGAVSDPIRLPREITTPQVSLTCNTSNSKGGTHAEFDTIAVYSAKGIRPVTQRTAVPKEE